MEPVPANMGLVLPGEGYLQGVRELTRRFGVLLIFDEVITGFRVAYGGAQERFDVRADLTCLGKIIGGGLPVGAYGGRREIMQMIAPLGPVYQAGTLSANPLAMRAGLEMLKQLKRPGVYTQLEQQTTLLAEELRKRIGENQWPVRVNQLASMLTLFFTPSQVVDFDTARSADTRRYAQFFHRMLDQGIFIAPSQYEALFASAAHSPVDLEHTLAASLTALGDIF